MGLSFIATVFSLYLIELTEVVCQVRNQSPVQFLDFSELQALPEIVLNLR